ncbi:MAG: choice-of-anchor E domain-containing protein [Acidimicrobiales bacterium]
MSTSPSPPAGAGLGRRAGRRHRRLVPASQADTTPAACTSVGPSLTDFTATLTLPKFDPALGTLTAVTLSGSTVTMRDSGREQGPRYQMGGDMGVAGKLTLLAGQSAMTSPTPTLECCLPTTVPRLGGVWL